MNVPVRNIAGAIENELNRKPKVSGAGQESGKIYISQRLSKILVRAEDEANGLKDEYISVEHIFLAILYETKGSPLGKVFETFGVTPDNFLKTLSEVRGNQRVTSDNPEDTYDALEKYGRDLVKAARARTSLTLSLDATRRYAAPTIRILSRKTKNNPVLIGEPGVGKTAIAEGLAMRIMRGDVPENLKDRIIFALDMGLADRWR